MKVPSQAKAKKARKTTIPLSVGKSLTVYSGDRVSEALKEILHDMPFYKGVRLSVVLEAVYDQGHRDGARAAFEEVDAAKDRVAHRNPGQPRKKKKLKPRKKLEMRPGEDG